MKESVENGQKGNANWPCHMEEEKVANVDKRRLRTLSDSLSRLTE